MNDDELAYTLNGEIRHYKNIWEKIGDEHYPECPTSIAAGKKLKSTVCVCAEIKIANDSADECLRCHQFPEFCKCGKKAQLVGGN